MIDRLKRRPRIAGVFVLTIAAAVAACGPSTTPSGPSPQPGAAPAPAPSPALAPAPPSSTPPPAVARAGFPGFDTGIYPGDAAMRTWREASPYVWVGYYLPAPCRRDVSWSGKREALVGMGWGTAVIYLGQQDWAAVPGRTPAPRDTMRRDTVPRDSAARDSTAAPAAPPACASAYLTAARGATEAADAAAKTAAEDFPAGSVIYLDVERVTAVSPALAEYVRGWIDGVLADGRFTPGIYCHRLDADALRQITRAAYAARGRSGDAPFWVASTAGFTLEQAPRGVGLDYANVWQGRLDTPETWGGVTLTIDANVADSRSPSGSR